VPPVLARSPLKVSTFRRPPVKLKVPLLVMVVASTVPPNTETVPPALLFSVPVLFRVPESSRHPCTCCGPASFAWPADRAVDKHPASFRTIPACKACP